MNSFIIFKLFHFIYYRGFKLIRMASNQEGESAITIPLQYNNSVRNYI